MARRRFTERQVIEVLIRQGAVIPCFRCRVALTLDDVPEIEREHPHELALGGADDPSNAGYSHGTCHKIATNGTKATSAGSSKNRIAKVKRLRGETRKRPRAKIQSRGFDKRYRKRLDGSVVLR